MSEWREEEREPAPVNWDAVKKNALIGAGCAGVVIAWMMFARPGEEASSSRGFNMGAENGPAEDSSGRPFARRSRTSLDLVSSKIAEGPTSVTPNTLPASPSDSPTVAASQSSISGPPPPAATIPASAPAAMPPTQAPPASAADEAKALASAGIPTDSRGLSNLGATDGMLTALAAKLLDHPKVLAAVFNNKTVVDAFMRRSGVQENCQSGDALKTYLSDPKSSGMTGVFPVIQKALSSPQTASGLVSALAGTEMAKRVGDCPSLKAVASDKSAITSIAMGNPQALGLLMDPRGMAAVASNPQAAGALAGLQSKMGGGP